MKRLILIACVWLQAAALSGQNNGPVVFSVDGWPVSLEEFARGYLKNKDTANDKPTVSDVNNYLELYKNYKLKVHQAYQMRLDTNPSFVSELSSYREQLAKPYLTDKNVTEELVKEAYQRMLTEINASHILVLVPEDALPADTLKAYRKITAIRNSLLKPGTSFGDTAAARSEDPSARDNRGNLGYFSVFDMIYPFETMAYNTAKGQMSPVFRTRFGYHFLKVDDIRDARGEVKVAHIMLRLNPDPNTSDVADQQRKIEAIHAELQNGARWEDLVLKYSEDGSSVGSNGELPWIASTDRRMPREIVEAAFSLKDSAQISLPVRSELGWHILRYMGRRPIASYEVLRSYLRQRVSRDVRSNKSEEAMVKQIRANQKYSENSKLYQDIQKTMDSSLLKGLWNRNGWAIQNKKLAEAPLVIVNQDTFRGYDFGNFIFNNQSATKNPSIQAAFSKYFTGFADECCLKWQERHLEDNYPDFRYLYQEYKDGLLIFSLMDQMVWSKSLTDTAGLEMFHSNVRNNYMWADRYDIDVYNAQTDSIYKKLGKQLKKGITRDSLLRFWNRNNPLALQITSGKFERRDNNEFANMVFNNPKMKKKKKYIWKVGKYRQDEFVYIRVNSFIPSQPKTLDEARGQVISDYQAELEKRWLSDLSRKYQVELNREVFENFRNQISAGRP